MVKYHVIALVTLLTLNSGCGGVPSEPKDYRSGIVVAFALSGLKEPPVAPEEEDTHAREDCPTGGWVGDAAGVRIRCGACRPSYYDGQPQLGAIVDEPFDRLNPAPVVDDPVQEPPRPPKEVEAKPETSNNQQRYLSPQRRVFPRVFRRGS